jgi:hypothetical protein
MNFRLALLSSGLSLSALGIFAIPARAQGEPRLEDRIDAYLKSFESDPIGFTSDKLMMNLTTELLPERFESFNKSHYTRALKHVAAQSSTHPRAALNFVNYLEERWRRIESSTHLVREANIAHQSTSTSVGVMAGGVTAASPHVTSYFANRTSALGTVKTLDAILKRQRWLKNPFVALSAPFVGYASGAMYHNIANDFGWSQGNLPRSPVEELGFNTEKYTKLDKADFHDTTLETIDGVLFLPLTPLVYAAAEGTTHLLLKPFECTALLKRVRGYREKHPFVRGAMNLLNPVFLAGSVGAYYLLDKSTDFVTQPLEESAYRNNYLRALQQLDAVKEDEFKAGLARAELFERMMEWKAVLSSRHARKVQRELASLPEASQGDEAFAKAVETYLMNRSWPKSPVEIQSLSWMKQIESNPDETERLAKLALVSVKPGDIDNSALLFLYTAAYLEDRGMAPNLKGVPLLREAFTEWTNEITSSISLKGENK